jgi:hypothetical protein
MWRTCAGDRVLRGAEWDVFRAALAEVADLVEGSLGGDDLYSSGIGAFDCLQPEQKLTLLALVARALSDEALPTPALTAHSEGAVAAVFAYLRECLEVEIESQDVPEMAGHACYWRGFVLAACREAGTGTEGPCPGETCDDLSEWELLIDGLAGRIFWDDDYRMDDHFLDADPRVARTEMRSLGIADEYYKAVVPDPDPTALEEARQALRRLTGRPESPEASLLPGFEDGHHGLLVGPCGGEAIERESACPLVRGVGVPDPGGFDCSSAEWVALFRDAVLQAAAAGRDARGPEPGVMLSPEQAAEAERARQTGEPLLLQDGYRAEPRGGAWVVVDGLGDFLVDVDEAAWSASAHDPCLRPLTFPGPAEAYAAFLRAEANARARADRYEAALTRLEQYESSDPSSPHTPTARRPNGDGADGGPA